MRAPVSRASHRHCQGHVSVAYAGLVERHMSCTGLNNQTCLLLKFQPFPTCQRHHHFQLQTNAPVQGAVI